jgi:hypothetical protein
MILLQKRLFKKVSLVVLVLFIAASMGMTTVSHVCNMKTDVVNTPQCCETIHNDIPTLPHPLDDTGITYVTCCFNNQLEGRPLDAFLVEKDIKTNRIDDFSLSFFPLPINDPQSAEFVSLLNITQRLFKAKPVKLHILNEAYLL